MLTSHKLYLGLLLITPVCILVVQNMRYFDGSVATMAARPFLPSYGKQVRQYERPTEPPIRKVCSVIGDNPLEKNNKGWSTFKLELQKYKYFHKKQLQHLRNSRSNYTGSRDTEQVRTLTWSCDSPVPCSGLGDQLYRIQYVFLLAVISKRVFAIYWNRETHRTTRYLQPGEIDWTFFDENLGMHKKRDMDHVYKIRQNSHFSRLAQLLQSSTPHITITHEIDVPFWNVYMRTQVNPTLSSGFKQLGLVNILDRPRYGKKVTEPLSFVSGMILRYLFTFSNSILSQTEEAQKQLGLRYQKYLAVHLRTGFLGTNFEEKGQLNNHRIFRSNSSWASTLECSLKLADKQTGSNSPIYLATDSYIVKKWASQKYGSRIRTTNTTLQHVAIASSSKSEKGSEATWIDFILLARAHTLVHGISGFSTMAGSFCSIPPSRQAYLLHCS